MLKKSIICLSFFLLSFNFSFAQDIITSPLAFGIVNYGDASSITFNVNPITTCDSYTITSEIDYFIKSITVKVEYNLNSFCDDSSFFFFETEEATPLLEGFYNVSIEVNVPADFTLNQTINLPSIFVQNAFPEECNNPFLFSSSQPCPTIPNPVCACDGQNYNNECEALFDNDSGAYYNFVCGDYVTQNSVPFDCTTFTLSESDIFEKYGCAENYYPGRELYLRYSHVNVDTLTEIRFRSNDISTRLFLISIDGDNLKCLAMSDRETLIIDNLETGEYILVADSERTLPNTIVEFCVEEVPTSVNVLSASSVDIFPNPSEDFITFNSHGLDIYSVVFYNTMGQVVINKRIDNNIVRHNLPQGIYQVVFITKTNRRVTKKIIVL